MARRSPCIRWARCRRGACNRDLLACNQREELARSVREMLRTGSMGQGAFVTGSAPLLASRGLILRAVGCGLIDVVLLPTVGRRPAVLLVSVLIGALHVQLLALDQGVGRILDHAIVGVQPRNHFDCRAVVLPDYDRNQV